MLGTPEMLVLAALLIALIFGPKKIKEFARSFGEAQSEYKKGKHTADEIEEDLEDVTKEEE